MQQEHTQPSLKLRELSDMMYHPQEVQQLLDGSRERIQKSRSYLESRLEERDEAIYGINTGFGFLCDRRIAKADLQQLQLNLIRSHACGQGEEVPEEIVRLMLLLKVKSLSLGFSGVRLETVERLLDFYNEDILPVVYTQGSLGASGDLAPLAHLTLPLIGEGEVRWKEQRMPAAQALQKLGWEPLQLDAKEGLALLNGTQFMGAYATYLVLQAQRLIAWADALAALSLDAFDGRSRCISIRYCYTPFDPIRGSWPPLKASEIGWPIPRLRSGPKLTYRIPTRFAACLRCTALPGIA
jgi:histidine ammonia-lyase